jgi:NAD(P)-dependent dehydrogenase (short-subunit alcohol dehydrogenase family)
MSADARGNRLADKVVVVTGGASGIGRAVAVRAAAEGAGAVVIADLDPKPREGGPPTTELVEALGSVARFVEVDVTDPDSITSMVDAADALGGADVLATCAGVSATGDFLEVTAAQLRRVMSVNFEGTYFACQSVARSMVARGAPGAIVTISSVGGIRGFGHATAYSASKGAVRTFTAALADALAPHGIRANAVHPGQVDTEMLRVEMHGGSSIRIPLGRKGRADEIADVVVFLASEQSSYMTGASVIVDGGFNAVIG